MFLNIVVVIVVVIACLPAKQVIVVV